MAATNKFKNWMAAKLGSILRKEISPDEITLGPVGPATGIKTSLVEVTYGGVKYPIVYDKFPINVLFGGATVSPVKVTGQPTVYTDALKLINARFGLSIAEEDVYPFNVAASIPLMSVEFRPSCYEFTGKIDIPLEWTGDFEMPKPLHEWLLQDNLKDTGESPVDMVGPITHFSNEAGKWASLGGVAHIPLPPGAELNRSGDYTLDLEVYFTAIPGYCCLLTTNKAIAGAPASIWWYNGTCYEYGVSSGTANIPAAKAKVPHRVTLVRKANKTTMYIDGNMAQTYDSTSTLPFIGFRDGDDSRYQFSSSYGLRNLRYWGRGLLAGELKELFKKPPVKVPQPLHMFELDGDGANSGTDTNPMTMEFNYQNEYGRIWAIRKRGGAELLGPNVKFEFNHDAVLDFEVLLVPGSDYRLLFTPEPGAVNGTGALMMYANKIYHAGIGYSGLADIMARQALPTYVPVRITKRLKSGKMYVYVNGLLYMTYPFTLTKPYIAIGDADGGSNPHAAPNRIRAISYWSTALSDDEFNALLSVAPPNMPKPTHQFLLDGSDANTGINTTSLGTAMTYETVGGKVYGKRTKPGGEKLSTVFKLGGDYVLDMVLYPISLPYKSVLFAPSSGVPDDPYYGSVMFLNGKFYHAHMSTLGTPLENRPALNLNSPNRLVIRKQGNAMSVYLNQVLITTHATTSIKDYDTFGYAGYDAWHQGNLMRAVRFWEGTVSDNEFAAIMANNI